MNKKYYEAYNERYKTIHKRGVSWSSDQPTPIVLEKIHQYSIDKNDSILEIGCGEGRDAKTILDEGYKLLASDISSEAIKYCKKMMPSHADNFICFDCLKDEIDNKFKFIFSIAVIHMLVLDEDRNKFFEFIKSHLMENGIALICSMGDGVNEMSTDASKAFEIVERHHESGDISVVSTSCRMVSFEKFENEIEQANLTIIEKGITSSLPDFNNLMYVLVK